MITSPQVLLIFFRDRGFIIVGMRVKILFNLLTIWLFKLIQVVCVAQKVHISQDPGSSF